MVCYAGRYVCAAIIYHVIPEIVARCVEADRQEGRRAVVQMRGTSSVSVCGAKVACDSGCVDT